MGIITRVWIFKKITLMFFRFLASPWSALHIIVIKMFFGLLPLCVWFSGLAYNQAFFFRIILLHIGFHLQKFFYSSSKCLLSTYQMLDILLGAESVAVAAITSLPSGSWHSWRAENKQINTQVKIQYANLL